jgi:hypothetical protein
MTDQPMADLVRNLRRMSLSDPSRQSFLDKTCVEAADAIERLEREMLKWHRVAMEAGAVTCSDGGHLYPLRDRATAAESSLKEAMEVIRPIVEANDEFRAGMPFDWEGDPLQDACDRARAFIDKDLPTAADVRGILKPET